jgi:hypothetical protein
MGNSIRTAMRSHCGASAGSLIEQDSKDYPLVV